MKSVRDEPDRKGGWEDIDINPRVIRLPVPGGWIYYVEPSHREPVGMFVPEPVGFRLNCPKCNEEEALEPHECPLKGSVCTCGQACTEHCRQENQAS